MLIRGVWILGVLGLILGASADAEAQLSNSIRYFLHAANIPPDLCDPADPSACGRGRFCRRPAGRCGSEDIRGVCVLIPHNCPDVHRPVCGCDGITYENRCEAHAAAMSLGHAGPCRQVCGGVQGLLCDEGEFCDVGVGHCCCDFQGVCRPIPEGCPEIYRPVCGCDGVTYSNRCEAHSAGVSIDHAGPCRRVCGGIQGLPCDEGEYCHLRIGQCCCDFQGVCMSIPDACPTVYEPVCGCDGMTYGNACEAAAAGESIEHRGPCEQVCGGIQGLPCDKGEYCDLGVGRCCCDFQGVCQERALGCPDNYDPVCGCDGVTYGNACEAAAAGVSIDHADPC